MDLYFLNFKHILIVLTSPEMRTSILKTLEDNEIEAKIKFTNSYSEAAKLVHENKVEPFNHYILNLSFNNKKLFEFVEYIQSLDHTDPNFLIEYRDHGELLPVQLEDNDE